MKKALNNILLILGLLLVVCGILIKFVPNIITLQPLHFKGLNKYSNREDIYHIYGKPDETIEYIYPTGQFYDVYNVEYLGVNGEIQVRYFDDTDEKTVYSIADEIIKALNQNTVLIEKDTVIIDFYGGK